MVVELSPLPYGYADLAPHISERTLSTHHAKHHGAYVNNTNTKVQKTELEDQSLENIIRASSVDSDYSKLDSALKQDIFNNAAQVFNHQFFWHCMSPNGGGRPSGDLLEKIERFFGSYEKFLDVFRDAAMKQFGSGWCWLLWNTETKSLAVESTSNAGTPITHVSKKPILVIDVWEHAYYLDYINQRRQFVDVFCEHLINWRFVAEKLREIAS